MNEFRKLNRQEVYERLRRRIVELDLAPGDAVSESLLAAGMGVSRTPVREAIILLEKDRLMDVVPQVGTYVAKIDLQQVREAQFLREAVEVASIQTISKPLDDQLVRGLEENLEKQHSVRSDSARFLQLDEAFHRGLMELAGHARSWRTVASAKSHLDRARMHGLSRQSLPSLIEQHETILKAVTELRLSEAARHLRHHLRLILTDIETIDHADQGYFVERSFRDSNGTD